MTPRRILFATTNYSYFTLPVTQALRQLGYQVKIFDYQRPNFITRLTGLVGLEPYRLKLINQALITATNYYQPDYLLVIKGDTITPQTINRISRAGVITINWYPDWFDSWKWIIRHAPAYRFFINTCLETHHRLKRSGVPNFYLPLAAPSMPKLPPLSKIYPITFIGQHTPRRERYFKAIADLGLHIWGHRWHNTSLSHLFHGPVSVGQAHQIIRHSQLVVNILNGSDTHQPLGINVRTYETTALGTCLLVHATPLLKHFFTPGQEVITFTTPQHLRHQAKYYLHHPEEQQAIALAGYKHSQKDHTFIIRLKQLFDVIRYNNIL